MKSKAKSLRKAKAKAKVKQRHLKGRVSANQIQGGRPDRRPSKAREGNEYIQVALRNGMLFIKGAGRLTPSSEKEYQEAIKLNQKYGNRYPVQPPVKGKGINSPTTHKPKSNKQVGRATFTLRRPDGTLATFTTADLERKYMSGEMTAKQVTALVSAIYHKFKPSNFIDPIAHARGKRGLTKDGKVK